MTFPLTTGVPAATLALENAAVTALASSQTAITSAGVLQGASPTVVAPVVVAVQSASAAIAAAISASDADTVAFSNLINASSPYMTTDGFSFFSLTTPIADPAALVSEIEAALSSIKNTAALLTAQSYIDRAAINLALNTD